MKFTRISRLIVVPALGLILARAVAVDPDEFAVGWPLGLVEGSEFYDIPLTADVYRYARDVSQMAVLDANDEPMPFYRVRFEPDPGPQQIATLGVSPVYQTRGGEVIAGLTLETTDQVARLSIAPDSPESATIVAFVADAGELETPPLEVDLDWRELGQPFMTSVVISHSEDLDRWDVIGRGTIASLEIDGGAVRHSRIPVEGRSGGYYRIDWSETTPEPWVLEQLSLISETAPDPAPVELVTLQSVEGPTEVVPVDENALYFDAGGLVPARALELVFARPNRWANATIFGAHSLEGPWQRVSPRRLYYRLEFEGRELSTPALQTPPSPARYWKVRPDRELDEINLRLHYVPERLRFAANGSAPYRLVGGGRSTEAGPDPLLRQVWEQLADDPVGGVAELGAMMELGGEGAFTAPYEFPWRVAFLWGALLAAALTVAWMALRLGRDAFRQT